MNKRIPPLGRLIAAVLLVGATAILFVSLRSRPTRAAGLVSPITSCRAAGTYGYTGTGYTYPGNALGLPEGNASTNGTITVGSDGKLTIKEWQVIGGEMVLGDQPFTFQGQATINPDCTFTATLSGGTQPALAGVIVDKGNQVRAMSLIPGVQVNYISTEKVQMTTGGDSQQ